ncbi:MAG TPA: bifunctional phosphoribosylaminoimidazolecarboxamide formyltransferase/IMP cyclohydrolase [Thermoanaerobaculia bacterium]|nr:bifunctional phosphoribosylaminoimidazolecarboxamide formyltransferase/IMP cyclohydrolase [Thermoanaerobaculia bacterium]
MRPRALLSVSDKRGLEELARGLVRLGFELLSTGGTLAYLAGRGLPVRPVAEITGYPEILDGRVKTLHPRIHGGIMARRGSREHQAQLAAHGIRPIDLVVVNLYPFRETAAAPAATAERVVESIDVGGPAMLRAAAKNFEAVGAVVDPDDYGAVLAALEAGGGKLPDELRRRLAAKAFRHTHDYDRAIAGWLDGLGEAEPGGQALGRAVEELFPDRLTLDLEREMTPRYGENPHQAAAVYRSAGGPGILGGFAQLQGKELSWNNLLDADAARQAVALFAEPAAVIVKHNNPCGVGRGESLAAAFERALATDPVAAYGSIVAVNRPVDAALAGAVGDLFVEVLVAPGFDDGARERFAAKRALRLLVSPPYQPGEGAVELRGVDGGFLAQAPDAAPDDPAAWRCPTRRQPTPEERRALEFAWAVVRHVKSNAIVLAGAEATVGIGAGQMSRVDACELAVRKARQAGLATAGAAAASDAFLPFRDGLDRLAEAGIAALVQPGGSKRDEEVVAAADEHGMAMLFTGRRHFRH